MGKSFRNEVKVEHFIFRSCEFEQMEMEVLRQAGGGTQGARVLEDGADELVEERGAQGGEPAVSGPRVRRARPLQRRLLRRRVQVPVGGGTSWRASPSRTDYDLKAHSEASGKKLSFFAQATGERYIPARGGAGGGGRPAVCSPCCATRTTRSLSDADGKGGAHRAAAASAAGPDQGGHPAPGQEGRNAGGRPQDRRPVLGGRGQRPSTTSSTPSAAATPATTRFGTPYAITVDTDTLSDDTVTVRQRDDRSQDRIPVSTALEVVAKALNEA